MSIGRDSGTGGAPPAGPRTLLVTGPGGAGRTTLAAATALAGARAGQRTLLLTAEEPVPLTRLLSVAPPGWPAEPSEVAPGLWATRIDSAARFRDGALAVQERNRETLEALGAAALDRDELTELPGAHALALLQALRGAHQGGGWDLFVVDLPPLTEAIRLLALPEELRRYLRRLLPAERQTARALRPLLAQLAGVPLPARGFYETVAGWDEALAEVSLLTSAPGTSVRLVIEPGARAASSVRAARAGLALHGLAVDAVVANRMVPAASDDPWLAALAECQRSALRELADDPQLAPVPLYELPHLGRGPEGLAELAALSLPPAAAATGLPSARWPIEDRLADDGLLIWRLPLPGAVREELDLVRRGDELIVRTGPFRRCVPLPAALRRCTVAGAAFEHGELAVRFAPDPAQWPVGALTGAPPFG